MTYRCEIDFKNECDIPKYAGYKKYHFIKPGSDTGIFPYYDWSRKGNVSITRGINKNIMFTPLPVSEYLEGGLAVDIGFTEDNFSISVEAYSYDEYRYLMGLVKCNTGLWSGTFKVGPDDWNPSVLDSYTVVIRTCNSKMESSKGFYAKIDLTLSVVDTGFAIDD